MKRLTENERTAIAVANAITKQRKRYEQKITRLEWRVMLYEKEITEMRLAARENTPETTDTTTRERLN